MEEDMDSLFEGMVLFTPTTHSNHQDQNQHQLDPNPKPEQKPEPELKPKAETEPDQDQSPSQPLDENLFSDLTLNTEIPSSDPSPSPSPSPSPLLSRQSSTIRKKKKRASGLRIGYGRQSSTKEDDVQDDDDGEEPPEVSTASPTDIPSSEKEPPVIESESQAHPSTTLISQSENNIREIQDQVEEEQDSSPSSPSNQDQINESPTIEQKFEEIKKINLQRLKNAEEAVASVFTERKDSIKRRRKASDSLSEASSKYRDLEKELEQACEAEDFEEADRLSQSLSSADKEKEILLSSLRNAEADCDALDSKMQHVLQSHIQAQEQCASLLKTFSMEAKSDADSILKNAEEMFSKEMENWLISSEALHIKNLELEIETLLMHEARSIVNESLDHSIEDDRKERDLLYKQKDILTQELENLLALVKLKEAEISENNSNIDKIEKKIDNIVSTFQQGNSSIDIKYNNLQSSLSEVKLENDTLSKRKEEIDANLSEEEAKGAKIKELSLISTNEAITYLEDVELRKSLLQFILRYKEDKMRLANTEEKLSEHVQNLKHQISSSRASLQELSSTKSSVQQESESLRQRLIFIDKRAPELDSEKKIAATARNFKEAAKLAAEAKTLSSEREETEAKIEGLLLELKKVEEEIQGTIEIVHETEGQKMKKEKELALARIQRLNLIAGSAEAERLGALELGDIEEAEILLKECEFARNEAKRLEPIYDIKEEEIENLPKYFVSVELVSKYGGKKLEELAASAHIVKSTKE